MLIYKINFSLLTLFSLLIYIFGGRGLKGRAGFRQTDIQTDRQTDRRSLRPTPRIGEQTNRRSLSPMPKKELANMSSLNLPLHQLQERN